MKVIKNVFEKSVENLTIYLKIPKNIQNYRKKYPKMPKKYQKIVNYLQLKLISIRF